MYNIYIYVHIHVYMYVEALRYILVIGTLGALRKQYKSYIYPSAATQVVQGCQCQE